MAQESDPAYAAYLRALGFDEDLARNDATLQRTQALAGAKLAKPELLAQGEEAREGISDSYEDRGMFLGSERLRDLAGQRRNELYRTALIDKGAADTVADIGMGLQRELAGINKQRVNAQQSHQAYLDALAAEAAGGANDPMTIVMLGQQTQQAGLPPGVRTRAPMTRPTARREQYGG